jgi:hypothetical protein
VHIFLRRFGTAIFILRYGGVVSPTIVAVSLLRGGA